MTRRRIGGSTRPVPLCLPVLRMPPFPGAHPQGRPTLRAIRDTAPLAPDDEAIAGIASRIAQARVGGDFWSAPAQAHRPDLDRSRGAAAGQDPWALIEQGEPIFAAADDEVAWLTSAAGRIVLHPETGQPQERSAVLRALHRHLAAFDYHDPWTGDPITVERWIDILGDWRRTIEQNREIGAVYGIAAWKRPVLGQFLWTGGPPRFGRPRLGKLRPDASVAVWPSRVTEAFRDEVRATGYRLVQIEDGFLRSAGLGVRLNPPFSIVVDRSGVYYDPESASDLEAILCEAELGPELCARAGRLIGFLKQHGITKYDAGSAPTAPLPTHRRTVLVPGQVADDRSVVLGGAGVTGPLDLLRRVRQAEPDAFIVYKPHPDVVAGLRPGHVEDTQASRYADTVVSDTSMDVLLSQVDAVHVLSSLAGFEGLLRGCEVITHGQPFYAGWGLTRDLAAPIARRGRRLTLEQLAAGTLILYPRYLDPVTRLPCPPEVLAERLATGRTPKPGVLQALRGLQGFAQRRFAERRR